MSGGIADDHLSFNGDLTSYWRNGQFCLYLTVQTQSHVVTLYKSVDRSESWSCLGTYEAYSLLHVSPHDGVFYACRQNPNPDDPNHGIILRSTDDGLHWAVVGYSPACFSHIVSSPINSNVIFGGHGNTGTTMIQWST